MQSLTTLLELPKVNAKNTINLEVIQVLEDHLTYLRTHSDTMYTTVDPEMAFRYKGDFIGLLEYYRVGVKYHYITMRLNYLTNPQDYAGNVGKIYLPSEALINRLLSVHKTSASSKK